MSKPANRIANMAWTQWTILVAIISMAQASQPVKLEFSVPGVPFYELMKTTTQNEPETNYQVDYYATASEVVRNIQRPSHVNEAQHSPYRNDNKINEQRSHFRSFQVPDERRQENDQHSHKENESYQVDHTETFANHDQNVPNQSYNNVPSTRYYREVENIDADAIPKWRPVEETQFTGHYQPNSRIATSYSHASIHTDQTSTPNKQNTYQTYENQPNEYTSAETVSFETLMPSTYRLLRNQENNDNRYKRKSKQEETPIFKNSHGAPYTNQDKFSQFTNTETQYNLNYQLPPHVRTYPISINDEQSLFSSVVHQPPRSYTKPTKIKEKEDILLVAIPRSKLSDFQKVYHKLFNKKLQVNIKELPKEYSSFAGNVRKLDLFSSSLSHDVKDSHKYKYRNFDKSNIHQ